MEKLIASARPYRAELGEGLELRRTYIDGTGNTTRQVDTVHLWQQGHVIATAEIGEVSVYDFWYHLKFREAFPQITHWRTGAAWEGQIQIDALQGEIGNGTFYGYFWLGDDPQEKLWEVSSGAPVTIAVPTLANDVGDVLGQLALARAIVSVLNGEQFIGVQQEFSNLARRDATIEDDLPTLEEALPMAHQAWRSYLPLRFKSIVVEGDPAGQHLVEKRLALEDAPDIALRELFCERLGLASKAAIFDG